MLDLHGFGNQLLLGAVLTLEVASASLLVGVVLGMLGAVAKLFGPRFAAAGAQAYTTVVRGIPDLLIIFIVYFGSTTALSKLFGRYVEVNSFWAGVAALGFVFGAYATEIFRGAVLAVPPGQLEAARAVGLSGVKAFFLVVLPQAWRYSLPPLSNQTVALLKQTSLISVVGLEELMRKAAIAAGATRQPFTFYLSAALIYLVLCGVITVAFSAAQSRANRGLIKA